MWDRRPPSPISTDEERAMFEENEIALRNAVEKYMKEHDITASEIRFVSRPSNYVRQRHFVGQNIKEITEAMSQAGLQWDHCDLESVHTATYPARDHGATYKCIIPQASDYTFGSLTVEP